MEEVLRGREMDKGEFSPEQMSRDELVQGDGDFWEVDP